MKIFQITLIQLLLFSGVAHSCDELVIPTKVEIISREKVPTLEKPIILQVIVPEVYEGWMLSGASFVKGKSQIGVAPQSSQTPGNITFEIYGTADIFLGSELKLSYIPIPQSTNGNVVQGMACLHTQTVKWGI